MQRALIGLAFAAFVAPVFADAIYSRDANQPVDDAYGKKIAEYTTDPSFNSPLTNYLPASTDRSDAAESARRHRRRAEHAAVFEGRVSLLRSLAQSSPRVKVFRIGKTEEGRDMIAVAIADETLLAGLKENDARLAQARRSAHDQSRRCESRCARRAIDAGLLHHRHHPFAGNRRADRADGARLSARRRRIAVHQENPRAHDHFDHAGRRSGRPRSHGRSVQLASRQSRQDAAAAAVLGPLRRARQQPRRDGPHARAVAQRARHVSRLARAGSARSARIGAVPLRQHRRRRAVQRVGRSDPRRRMAAARLGQRAGHDQARHAGRVHARRFRYVESGLSDVHGGDA